MVYPHKIRDSKCCFFCSILPSDSFFLIAEFRQGYYMFGSRFDNIFFSGFQQRKMGSALTELSDLIKVVKEGSDENKIFLFFLCSTMYSDVWLLSSGNC
jgi:hypothetical protein